MSLPPPAAKPTTTAPAESDKLAPSPSATWPEAWQRLRPDAEIAYGKVSSRPPHRGAYSIIPPVRCCSKQGTFRRARFTRSRNRSSAREMLNARWSTARAYISSAGCCALAPSGPRSHRAAERRDELAPPDHSITSLATASTDGGTSRPSAFAVLRLSTNSYFVGACTGKSAGFSPLRMRST
jgi:hypothetical protein